MKMHSVESSCSGRRSFAARVIAVVGASLWGRVRETETEPSCHFDSVTEGKAASVEEHIAGGEEGGTGHKLEVHSWELFLKLVCQVTV